jgi:hypothetical protein
MLNGPRYAASRGGSFLGTMYVSHENWSAVQRTALPRFLYLLLVVSASDIGILYWDAPPVLELSRFLILGAYARVS